MIPRDTSAIKELLFSYGVNKDYEEKLENELLTGNPFEVDINYDDCSQKSKAAIVNDELLYGIGVQLVHDEDYEEPEDPLEAFNETYNKWIEEHPELNEDTVIEDLDDEVINLIECIDEENDIWLGDDDIYYYGDGTPADVEFVDEDEDK